MFIAILTLLSALSISGVAIFYSVIGLATIFPGAFWPVVIMGGVLEVGKLVTASWLYRNWRFTRWMLRIYLTLAVIILSAITSMGIFGFLSKAHLEQNLAEGTVTQRIEIINSKIQSEQTYIQRQKDIITRAENSMDRSTTSNSDALDIEIQSLKDAEKKFQTLLAVETNTVKDLNDRLRTLDRDVSDVLKSDKPFFNEEKAAADLKSSQKAEREQIASDISKAQDRIQILKDDYAKSTTLIQSRIDKLRQSKIQDNTGVNTDISKAEQNILSAQNRIDGLIVEREPLESQMLKLEAEVGPVKYIAALAVDFGWTDQVNTSEAVRWVILIIIIVFDPLAVLLLIAANQSLIRRFPVKEDPPAEIIDLEKPDLDPPPVSPRPTQSRSNEEDHTVSQWNNMIDRMNELAANERKETDKKLESTVKQWQEKLEKFNDKVTKPAPKDIEIVPLKEQDNENNHDGFDVNEVKYDMDPVINAEWEDTLPERIKPNFTEVIEPEGMKTKPNSGTLGQRLVDKQGKVVDEKILPKASDLTEQERTGLLNKFHQEHGKFQDISDVELKEERDQSNRAKFLEDVGMTDEDAKKHPPITKSRMAFFQDHVDDILRGDTTAENLPPEIAKTCAVIMSDFDGPQVIEPETAPNNAVEQTGLSTMTTAELKEKFDIEPRTEDRDITNEELDKLLDGFREEEPTEDYDIVIKEGKKIKVPKQKYVQNEEQISSNNWSKIQELDSSEPEKNEVILPEFENTSDDEIVEITDDIKVETILPKDKIKKHKNKMLTDEQYQEKIEARINDLITKLENNEIKFEDLVPEDKQVVLGILNDKELNG